jgi:YD repeat-containing protein
MLFPIDIIGLQKVREADEKQPVNESFLGQLGKDARIVGEVQGDGGVRTFTVESEGRTYRCSQDENGRTVARHTDRRGTTATFDFDRKGDADGFRTENWRESAEYDSHGRLISTTDRLTGVTTKIEYGDPNNPFVPTKQHSYSLRHKRSRYVRKGRVRQLRRSLQLARLRKLKSSALGRRLAELKDKLEKKEKASESKDKPEKTKEFKSSAPVATTSTEKTKAQTVVIPAVAAAAKGAMLALAATPDNSTWTPVSSDGVPGFKAVSNTPSVMSPEQTDVAGPAKVPFLSASVFVQPAVKASDGMPIGEGSVAVPLPTNEVAHGRRSVSTDVPVVHDPQHVPVPVAALPVYAQGERAERGGYEMFMPTGWAITPSRSTRGGKVRSTGFSFSFVDRDAIVLDPTSSEQAMAVASLYTMPLPVIVFSSPTGTRVDGQKQRIVADVTPSKQGEGQGGQQGGQGQGNKKRDDKHQQGGAAAFSFNV